jgi:hypothetical protein
MRLLFRDADFRQRVKNRLALDFQLSGQIVDSNLAHPPFLVSARFRYFFMGTPSFVTGFEEMPI